MHFSKRPPRSRKAPTDPQNARPQSPTVLEQGRDTACYQDGTDPQKCATAVPDSFGTRPRYRMLHGQYRSAKMRDRSTRQFWNKAEIPHATRTAPIRKNVPQEPPSTRELRNELVLKAILKGKCTFRSGRPAIRKSPPTRKLPNELVLKGTLKGKCTFRDGRPATRKSPPHGSSKMSSF